MATIRLDPDNVHSGIRWMTWVEQGEVIGQILEDRSGLCYIKPDGPYWSPMKSFAAFSFASTEAALAEVQLYFQGR